MLPKEVLKVTQLVVILVDVADEDIDDFLAHLSSLYFLPTRCMRCRGTGGPAFRGTQVASAGSIILL